jgi:hypothetical protein
LHISEGRVFHYCKIRVREHPENPKEKSPLVFRVLACQNKGDGERKGGGHVKDQEENKLSKEL